MNIEIANGRPASNPSLQVRVRATNIALAATSFLTVAKMVVSIATGSVGVLSEAIHSGLDLISSLVTYFVVRASARPADADHPFGHGKMESISAMFEAFLLLLAGGYIFYEGVSKWINPGHEVHHLGWGLIVIGISVVVNLAVYFQNRKVAQEEESIAIETNSFHFLTDVFSSLAVFAGLATIYFTGLVVIDSIIAILIAGYTVWVGTEQIKKCLSELSDTALPADEVSTIESVISVHHGDFINYHDLRTRRVGRVRHVDLHLTVCSEHSVHEAHEICDRIEDDLQKQFKEVHAAIHIEPCHHHGPGCVTGCSVPGRTKHGKPRS